MSKQRLGETVIPDYFKKSKRKNPSDYGVLSSIVKQLRILLLLIIGIAAFLAAIGLPFGFIMYLSMGKERRNKKWEDKDIYEKFSVITFYATLGITLLALIYFALFNSKFMLTLLTRWREMKN